MQRHPTQSIFTDYWTSNPSNRAPKRKQLQWSPTKRCPHPPRHDGAGISPRPLGVCEACREVKLKCLPGPGNGACRRRSELIGSAFIGLARGRGCLGLRGYEVPLFLHLASHFPSRRNLTCPPPGLARRGWYSCFVCSRSSTSSLQTRCSTSFGNVICYCSFRVLSWEKINVLGPPLWTGRLFRWKFCPLLAGAGRCWGMRSTTRSL